MSRCRRCVITGRVQGVFYRASTQRRAEALGLTGHARNLPDGRVEVLVCGRSDALDALDALEAWLWQGPAAADVTDVSCESVQRESPERFITG